MAYEFIPGVGWADVVDYGTEEAAQAALNAYQDNFIQQVITPGGELANINLEVEFGLEEDVYTQVQGQLAAIQSAGNTLVTQVSQLPIYTPPAVSQLPIYTPPAVINRYSTQPEPVIQLPPAGGIPLAGVNVGLFDDVLPKIGGAIGDIALMPVIILMAAGNKRAGDFLPLVLLLSMMNDNIPEPYNTPGSGGIFNKGVADGWY